MDLNYLFHRHGTSLMMADNAACEDSRRAHRSLARSYAAKIAEALSARPVAAL